MKAYLTHYNNQFPFIFTLKISFTLTVLFVVIDYLNFLTKIGEVANIRVITLLIIGFIFISILLSIEWHLFDILKIKSLNVIDLMLITTIFSSIFYLISIFFLDIDSSYKTFSIILIIFLSFFLITLRISNFSILLNKQEEYTPNVLDLKKIYENDFEIAHELPILVDEKDVQYDLLGRDHIINLLTTSILNTNPSTSFVISLEGSWGSGKTTLLNITKSKLKGLENDNNIIIIDDLDPWSYETPESLFNGMFNRILSDANINFNFFEISRFINQVNSEFFGDKKINIFKSIIFPQRNLEDIKRKINDHLRLSNKKVVFFIDNIDRAEKENINILFKLVGNILDFERVIYILSFDNNRVKKILEEELNIDYQFVKKIVQMQIRVPLVDKRIYQNIFEVIISNILSKYKVLDDNHIIESNSEIIESHTDLINFMARNTDDLRDFKIFINSALNFSYRTMNFLNKRDLLILEYIRLNNINLYQEIYNNSIFFVSHDRELDSTIQMQSSLYNKQFDALVTEYYNKLFEVEENNKYIYLLEVIFPYVANYHKNKNSKVDNPVTHSDISFETIHRSKSISSYKYFILYFTYTDNKFIEVNRILDQFVHHANQSPESTMSIYSNMITDSTENNSSHILLSTLEYYLADLSDQSKYHVMKSIYLSLKRFDPTVNFDAIDTQYRCINLISRMIEVIDEEDFTAFIISIEQDYSRVKSIADIIKSFAYLIKNNTSAIRSEILKNTFSKLAHSIIEEKINIYADDYYQMWNIGAIKGLYESDDTYPLFKNYIYELIHERNVFRFLWDITTISSNSYEVRYYLQEKRLTEYTSKEHIESILSKTTPSNDDEKLVLNIFKELVYSEDDDDFNVNKGLRFSKYLQPNL